MPDFDSRPLYLGMSPGERKERVKKLTAMLESCTLCPRSCGVNRAAGEAGKCGARGEVIVDAYSPHFGEESVLSGQRGSGTIFFVHCNLECVFCQNWQISRGVGRGYAFSVERLAEAMLELQRWGCHNINLVSPTHFLPQVAGAIDLAAARGLTLPVVYNSGGYDSLPALRLLEGFVDIYMPDAKYSSDRAGEQYSGVKGYYGNLKRVLKEMQRQVGDLAVGPDGLAYRGLLVRHLVLPGDLAGTAALVRFLSEEISGHCAVNIMGQYYPAYLAERYPPLDRRLTAAEYRAARALAIRADLRLID